MGFRGPGLAERLRDRDRRVAPAWRSLLDAHGAQALLPWAAQGLADGDDLHSRTTGANTALVAWLRRIDAPADLVRDVETTPLFFLTIWMAAAATMLRAAEGTDMPSLVTRGGGNGERFGIALAGAPETWTTVDAASPTGARMGPLPPDTVVSAAIGDSVLIDMLGLGGQTLRLAPEPSSVLADALPADYASLGERLLTVRHPALDRLVAVDAARVVAHQAAPLIALALQAADGIGGFAGRGVYRPPVAMFEHALATI